MNFEEDFSQPLEPSLPIITEADKLNIADSKALRFDVLVKFFNRFSNMRGVKKSNYVK